MTHSPPPRYLAAHATSSSAIRALAGLQLLSLSLLLCALDACNPARERAGQALIPDRPRVSRDRIVAQVNGVPILTEELALQMRSGQPRRQALHSLIQRELLAQEAIRRGYDRRQDTTLAFKRAMANLFIRREFGDGITRETIPRDVVQRAYDLNRSRYVHEEIVLLAHIVVMAGAEDDAARHGKARRLIAEVRSRAQQSARSEAAFKQIAEDLSRDTTFNIKAESLATALRGTTVPEFADAAFALRRAGDLSPVVKTKFGYHVIYFKSRVPAENKPLSSVEDEIRDRIFEEYRRKAFDDWAAALEQRSAVADHSARLDNLPAAQ